MLLVNRMIAANNQKNSDQPIFCGGTLFELTATHGLPIDVALDRLVNDKKFAIDWISFVETARSNGWWNFQTYDVICQAMADALIDADLQSSIKTRLQLYITQNPHPKMNM